MEKGVDGIGAGEERLYRIEQFDFGPHEGVSAAVYPRRWKWRFEYLLSSVEKLCLKLQIRPVIQYGYRPREYHITKGCEISLSQIMHEEGFAVDFYMTKEWQDKVVTLWKGGIGFGKDVIHLDVRDGNEVWTINETFARGNGE